MELVAARSGWRTAVSDYFEMTKPRVQSLLLFTTVTTMYVAGDPSLELVALTCLGGALSAGGAGAINHVLDRDIDRTMHRTANRPVAAGRVSPAAGLAFGIGLGVAAFVLLATTVNLLAAARVLLFGARDVWFVVGLPVFLYASGWTFPQVGGFLALWTVGYGAVQAAAPGTRSNSPARRCARSTWKGG